MDEYEEEEECSRCGGMVGWETLIRLGDEKICEICWDDL